MHYWPLELAGALLFGVLISATDRFVIATFKEAGVHGPAAGTGWRPKPPE